MVELPNKIRGYLIWSKERSIISLGDQIRYFLLVYTLRNIEVR